MTNNLSEANLSVVVNWLYRRKHLGPETRCLEDWLEKRHFTPLFSRSEPSFFVRPSFCRHGTRFPSFFFLQKKDNNTVRSPRPRGSLEPNRRFTIIKRTWHENQFFDLSMQSERVRDTVWPINLELIDPPYTCVAQCRKGEPDERLNLFTPNVRLIGASFQVRTRLYKNIKLTITECRGKWIELPSQCFWRGNV